MPQGLLSIRFESVLGSPCWVWWLFAGFQSTCLSLMQNDRQSILSLNLWWPKDGKRPFFSGFLAIYARIVTFFFTIFWMRQQFGWIHVGEYPPQSNILVLKYWSGPALWRRLRPAPSPKPRQHCWERAATRGSGILWNSASSVSLGGERIERKEKKHTHNAFIFTASRMWLSSSLNKLVQKTFIQYTSESQRLKEPSSHLTI